MNDQTKKALDELDIVRIFREFDTTNAPAIFESSHIYGIRELLVEVFQSPEWTHPCYHEARSEFLSNLANIKIDAHQHRELFAAMAESGSASPVVGYLHMLKSKHKVKLSDGSALMGSSDLLALVMRQGTSIAGNIHYLSQAMTADSPATMRMLWSIMQKNHDPEHPHANRWLQAMQSIVNRYGLQATGLGATNVDNSPWIHLFFNTHDKRTMQVAGSVLASQISRHLLDKQHLISQARGTGDAVRLAKHFSIPVEQLHYRSAKFSHPSQAPDYHI